MKLLKQIMRRVEDRIYYRYVITIPPKTVHALGWSTDQELSIKIIKDKLIVKPRV